jgi:hypothetical protein
VVRIGRSGEWAVEAGKWGIGESENVVKGRSEESGPRGIEGTDERMKRKEEEVKQCQPSGRVGNGGGGRAKHRERHPTASIAEISSITEMRPEDWKEAGAAAQPKPKPEEAGEERRCGDGEHRGGKEEGGGGCSRRMRASGTGVGRAAPERSD